MFKNVTSLYKWIQIEAGAIKTWSFHASPAFYYHLLNNTTRYNTGFTTFHCNNLLPFWPINRQPLAWLDTVRCLDTLLKVIHSFKYCMCERFYNLAFGKRQHYISLSSVLGVMICHCSPVTALPEQVSSLLTSSWNAVSLHKDHWKINEAPSFLSVLHCNLHAESFQWPQLLIYT